MLIKITCEKFRTKEINFHSGLNAILGDSVATNSIGKSNLLMVVDFAFGGDSFIRHNFDVPKELGHHDYHFHFSFGGEVFRFRRNTFTPDLVHRYGDELPDGSPMSIEDYRAFLKAAYALGNVKLSFRSIVSPFSRIWGKDNLDVKQPLHAHVKEKSSTSIDNLIKLYTRFDEIETLSDEVKNLEGTKSALNNAYKQHLIPKSNLTKYRQNLQSVTRIDAEIQDIKDNLSKYAVSIGEIVNRRVSDLKATRDSLVSERDRLSASLARVQRDLDRNKYVKSKAFKTIERFFPEANLERIADVEAFHSRIAFILREELRESERELSQNILKVKHALESVDKSIGEALGNIEEPSEIVDRVHDLARVRGEATREIEYFESEKIVIDGLRSKRLLLSEKRSEISSLVENIINNKIRKLVDVVYSEARKSPRLEIKGKTYTFSAIEDTGTGKAYSNLILLDLAVLQTTTLPFVIHDSVLFKNIENAAVAKLIDIYSGMDRQTFIAIDEIQKYGASAEATLNDGKVIQLSNEAQLYTKDWRS